MLEQLDHSSILLMYLADELSAPERAEVDRRLGLEPVLAQELDSLRATHADFYQMLAGADKSFPLAGETSALLRIGRAMRQRQLHQPAKPPRVKLPRIWHRLPSWSYPLTAAAAVLLVLIGWWAHKPVSLDLKGSLAMNKSLLMRTDEEEVDPKTPVDSVEAPVNLVEDTMENSLEQNFRNSNPVQNSRISELRQIERQVAELSLTSADPVGGALSDYPLFSEDE